MCYTFTLKDAHSIEIYFRQITIWNFLMQKVYHYSIFENLSFPDGELIVVPISKLERMKRWLRKNLSVYKVQNNFELCDPVLFNNPKTKLRKLSMLF